MFHIQGLDGIQFNIPLEDLRVNNKVYGLEKGNAVRKLIDRKEGQAGNEPLRYAIKAYKKAVKITDEREPVLHAYKIMKSPVFTLEPEMNAADAWNILKEKRVSHMPVLSKNNKIAGILSDKDLLKCLCVIECNLQDIGNKKVADVMKTKVITSSKITDIRRIAKAMFENHVGAMPVVEDTGDLTGIITRSDILYALIYYPPLSLWI